MTRRDNPRDSMIPDILRRLRALETASPLGSSSITRGALRVASNEGLKVEGSAKVSGWLIVTGTARVTGRLEGSGTFDWTGPMNLQGAQSVTGPTTFTGKVDINGEADINGPLDVLGVWKLTGDGTITGDVGISGNLAMKSGGKITVEGANPIVLQQEGGSAKVKVGTTGEISGADSGIQMMVAGDVNRRVAVKPTGIMLVGLPMGVGTPTFWIGADVQGNLFRYPSGSGGPMGGDFNWPFSLSIVTSEYGMRTHPVTGENKMHYGIDFGAPAGSNIPAASSGTVAAAGYDAGRGNYVVLSHPNSVETHYFHMIASPAVSAGQSVTKGQTLGQVGSTGMSSGAHLHFEVHVNGSAINPRNFEPLP